METDFVVHDFVFHLKSFFCSVSSILRLHAQVLRIVDDDVADRVPVEDRHDTGSVCGAPGNICCRARRGI